MNENYLQGLELLFLRQLHKNKADKESVYICSPLRSDTRLGTVINMQAAKAYLVFAIEHLGYAARAPHAYLPTVLNDEIPAQRVIALQYGLNVLEQSNKMFVCGNRLSVGMLGEIVFAAQRGKEISVFNKTIFNQVMQVVISNGGRAEKVKLDESKPIFSMSPEQLAVSSFAGRLFDAEVLKCYVNSNG